MHVAGLARIGVDGDDMEKYGDELIKILEYVRMLDEVAVDGCPPTYSVSENQSVMAEDEIEKGLAREAVLANAPRKDLVNIRTKGVFNE